MAVKGVTAASSLVLRDYQQEAVDTLFRYWQVWEGKRHSTQTSPPPCVLQLATGAGKSIVIADIVRRLKQPVLVLQPTAEILAQNKEKLGLAGVTNAQVCSASANDWKIGDITLATIGTIAKHWEYCQRFKVVVVDECDTVKCEDATSQYLTFFNNLAKDTRIVGLTATPYRNQTFCPMYDTPKVFCRPLTRLHCNNASGTRFGEWFWKGGIIYKCSIEDLQSRGYLAPVDYHVAKTDWSFLSQVPGRVDFDVKEMGQWVGIEANTSRFTQAIACCIQNKLKTIVFSPDIKTNFKLMQTIQALGGTAEVMDSNNDNRRSRLDKMDQFRRGSFQFLVNVGMVGRGVDVPSVDAVVLARPTKSLGLYIQFIGRCLRPDPDNPNKVAHVLDLSGNVERFGKVEDVKMGTVEREGKYGPFRVDCIAVKEFGTGKQRVWDQVS